MSTDFDRQMMQRCIQLARQAVGQTAPNPMVGAVVVQDGEVVGEGFHPGAGQPHAEVFALRDAGDRAQGSTVYVNLEPCNHYGRTPPCSTALTDAGVKKVIIGMVDPNPKVAGRGIDRLRAAGVEVVVGVEEAACQELNEAFSYYIQYQQPFGILKYAMTLDGKIAATGGHSAWITSPPARSAVHHLRAECNAVVIGSNTVRNDNPLLTAHGVGKRDPLRVVMSRSLDLPLDAQIWDTQIAPTLLYVEAGVKPNVQQELKQRRVDVVELSPLTPAEVMQDLYRREALSVLWECGGKLAAEAIAAGVIQKVHAFIAPKIIGGIDAPTPVGDLGLTKMTDAITLERTSWQAIGSDWLVTGYLP